MAEQISVERLSAHIDLPSGDPVLRRLIETINDLIARLEKDVRRQALFISDASHEMRTPIAVIKGYADLIRRWGKDDPQVLSESIDAIVTETERMNILIKSMLLLASGDDSEIPDKRPLLLNAVAQDAARETAMLTGFEHIEVICHSQETIVANYDMIRQMLRIFLDNGVKFSKNKNIPVEITVTGDGDMVVLTVRDYGIGIEEDDLPYIFERFYRADKSHSSSVPGFGLGLPVADKIARAHGASIGVYSEPGAGTEFTVAFPKYLPDDYP